jgi:Ca2+-binding RTX toxin-like protein
MRTCGLAIACAIALLPAGAAIGDRSVDGTPDDDILRGTSASDTIHARSGDDHVFALAGADRVYGNADSDRIRGGDGRDTIRGGTSRDRLFGETGADKVYGGLGVDVMWGGRGDDLFDDHGHTGDVFHGGNGFDVAWLRGGQDRASMGRRQDRVYVMRDDVRDRILCGRSHRDIAFVEPLLRSDPVDAFISCEAIRRIPSNGDRNPPADLLRRLDGRWLP